MMRVIVNISCILLIIGVLHVVKPSKISEQCNLLDNQNGICKEMKNCEYAKKLFAERRISEIQQCDFDGEVPVVCCPTSVSSQESKPSLCKAENIYDDVIIERTANIGEFPFFAALGYNRTGDSISYDCPGALITDDIVLAPARCINRVNSPQTVKLGKTTLNDDPKDYSEGEDFEIQSIKVHPKYSRANRRNELALIKLKRPAPKNSKYIKPICLSSTDENLPINFAVTGVTTVNEDYRRQNSNWVMKNIVNEYPFEKCKDELKLMGTEIFETQFCGIGQDGNNSCQGGPLSYFTDDGNVYLYGMGSYGTGCGAPFPDVYVKISPYLDWIYAEVLRL